MANHQDIFRAQQGKNVWNVWAEENPGASVDFSADTLAGINFKGFVFPGIANFAKTTVPTAVTFASAKFRAAANFQRANFSYSASFQGASFEGLANFLSSNFDHETAHFDGARFLDDVVFAETRFHQAVVFSDATFQKIADFGGTRFDREANFRNATFSNGPACFPRATFMQPVNFGGGRFGKSGTDFSGTSFKQHATFDAAEFAGFADYRRAEFIGEASFRRSSWHNLVAFNDAQFTTVAVFKDSVFRSVPTFHGATLHEDTTFEGVTWPKLPHDDQSPYDAARAWARLRVEMSRLHKYEDELSFFAMELRSRAQDRHNEPPAKRGLYRLYLALGAGRNVAKPLGWLLGLNAALFLPFYWYAAATIQNRKGSIWDILADAFTLNVPADVVSYTLVQALPFVGGSIPGRADLYRRLFAATDSTGIDLPLWLELVSAVQQLTGFALLFMIGLALRNRFRMK